MQNTIKQGLECINSEFVVNDGDCAHISLFITKTKPLLYKANQSFFAVVLLQIIVDLNALLHNSDQDSTSDSNKIIVSTRDEQHGDVILARSKQDHLDQQTSSWCNAYTLGMQRTK